MLMTGFSWIGESFGGKFDVVLYGISKGMEPVRVWLRPLGLSVYGPIKS